MTTDSPVDTAFTAPPSPTAGSSTPIPEKELAAILRYANPREPEKACPDPRWPAANPDAPPPGKGQRVLIIGDSLTKYSLPPLERNLMRQGWLPTVVCWGGTQTDWALVEARSIANQRYVPSRVVIAMGTNDVHKNSCSDEVSCDAQIRMFGRRAADLMDYLGPERQVYWLTIDMDADRAAEALGEPWNRNFPQFNRELEETLQKYPNAMVIPWQQIVAKNRAGLGIEYSWDGLHYDPVDRPRASAGTMLRVRTISEVLASSAEAIP